MLMQIKKIHTDMSMHHPQSTAWRNTRIKNSCHLLLVSDDPGEGTFRMFRMLNKEPRSKADSPMLITECSDHSSLQGNGELKLKI